MNLFIALEPLPRCAAGPEQGGAVLLLLRFLGRWSDTVVQDQLEKWNGLPPEYQSIVKTAAAMANVDMLAKYDAKNLAALRGLVAGGAQLRPYPKDVMKAALVAANKLYAEIAATNPDFATIRAHTEAFRNEANLWNQVAEYTFDTFQISNRSKGVI